jgi:hypothetical protein
MKWTGCMRKSSFTPVDIAGISLGVLVVLIVIGSLVVITRTGLLFSGSWEGAPRFGWQGEAESGAAGSADAEQTVEGTFTAVEVSGVAGEIVFTAHDGAGVKVRSVKRAPSQRSLDALRTEIRRDGGRLVVGEKREPVFLNPGSISFYISLPREVREVRAKTVSGRILVQGLSAGVRQTLETVSGSVETDGSGDLSAGTVSGSIQFAFAGTDLSAKTVSGSIRGTIETLDPNGRVEVDSVSGSVRLIARNGLNARASLHSLSGSVACGFPLSDLVQKRNSLEGTIGQGGASLRVGTTSGSIRIEKN